ncbi:FAD:protein FMN transferase [Polaribacter sp. IC073]|uniref:FAD:protein FMN transferase n=1 Tax=Polaribacter sp. IC073 TaxID=2508540 RepID=UPI0011BFD31E|nr:FAD:protein FMN transferase [Polaribacter sp. IC073]TXD46871.1 FAD:protein FMN transferase [Polaribacter sp. IC073]
MKHYPFFILCSIFLLFSTCKKEVVFKDYTLKGAVFGTTYKITYLNANANYQSSIDSLFLKMNTSLSTYIPTSDISRVNNGETDVIVDDFFVEVFEKSKRIFNETEGFFDPTVGNLVNAWGFGPKKEKNNLTDEQVIRQMQLVGLDKVALKGNRIVKESLEIYLDFNSIAKGFGIDVVARFLESKKINNYLVEIGGEIRTNGFKNKKQPWHIKLVDPIESNSNSGFKILNLSNKSMATSGNYRKFRVTKTGEKYVHTVNPKTGYATASNLLSVSVIANLDCADVDAYATAFMAMGLEKTKSFLAKKTELEVILLYTNNEGNLEQFTNYMHN